jgi:hypothetical protein
MFTRRIATAATLLVLFGAGCASHSGTNVAAGPGTATITPAAAVVESTTTTATTVAPVAEPAAEAAPEPAAEPAPVVNSAPKPASIEVDYQPLDGATATVTIDGPNGTHSKSLDSGAALFGGLLAGSYAVTITVDSPSGDPSIGDARTYLNGGTIQVEAGEHGLITCDDSGCTGPL